VRGELDAVDELGATGAARLQAEGEHTT
jgi:hypothetical protein